MKGGSGRSEVLAYPTLTQAAEMMGVAPSTLSRRKDLQAIRLGERDRRVLPIEVMRLSDRYKKVSINGVAAELIEYAHRNAPEHQVAIESQVDGYLASRPEPGVSMSANDFMDLARAELPKELAEAIARVLASAAESDVRARGARRKVSASRRRVAATRVTAKTAPGSSTPRKAAATSRRTGAAARRTSKTAASGTVTKGAAASRKSGRRRKNLGELEPAGTPRE